MSNETQEQTKINWDAFGPKAPGDKKYLKREAGKTYLVTFKANSLREEPTNFIDPKTNQPKPGMKLVLALETLEGKPTAMTMDITSKKEAMLVKQFLDANLLYVQKFSITPSGEGTQRAYSWINLGPK